MLPGMMCCFHLHRFFERPHFPPSPSQLSWPSPTLNTFFGYEFMFCDEPTQASQLSACDWWIVVKMAVAALFAVAPSWVTQMQSKYGVQVRTRTRPSEPQRAREPSAHAHTSI